MVCMRERVCDTTHVIFIVDINERVCTCMYVDDDEEGPASVDQEGEEDEDKEGKVEETEMMEKEGEEELDPLDAYMEEVKEEVKKFNMGTMKGGNDKVRHTITL